MNTCINCKWWDRHAETSNLGYCRRYAPAPQDIPLPNTPKFPVTKEDQKACGDWEKKTPPDE